MMFNRIKTMDRHLNYLATHIFLPPKLPQEEESDHYAKELSLLEFISTAVDEFRCILREPNSGTNQSAITAWSTVHRMLKASRSLYSSETLDADQTLKALLGMKVDGTSISFHPTSRALHICRCNSSLYYRPERCSDLPQAFG
jgi:hypothetical protein